MKNKKDSVDTWTDDFGVTLTREEMIEELKLLRLVNRNLHDLLFKYKVPVQAIANVENQAKKQLYPITKPVIHTEEVETKKPAVKRKRASKKLTRKKK